MKKAKTIYRIIFGIVLIVILAVLFFSWYQDNRFKQSLIEQNIYEIETAVHKSFPGNQTLRAYYMICKPKETEPELKQQIDDFLQKNQLVEQLLQQANKLNKSEETNIEAISIKFMHPTKSWPIGKFPTQGQPFDFFTGMCIASVFIDLDSPEDLQYSFLLWALDYK